MGLLEIEAREIKIGTTRLRKYCSFLNGQVEKNYFARLKCLQNLLTIHYTFLDYEYMHNSIFLEDFAYGVCRSLSGIRNIYVTSVAPHSQSIMMDDQQIKIKISFLFHDYHLLIIDVALTFVPCDFKFADSVIVSWRSSSRNFTFISLEITLGQR